MSILGIEGGLGLGKFLGRILDELSIWFFNSLVEIICFLVLQILERDEDAGLVLERFEPTVLRRFLTSK